MLILLALACRTKDLAPDSGVVDSQDPVDTVDSDCAPMPWYADADGDGYGDGDPVEECEAPSGYVEQAGDCDDGDAAVHPGAAEDDCTDPVDYNCDGSVGYADEDGDGVAACEDCDDADAAVHPGAEERCNQVDDDCDGDTDEDATDAPTWYGDGDGDGYGDDADVLVSCDAGEGWASQAGDCDDEDGDIHPGATEGVGDEVDQDCDGTELCAADADDDGFSDAGGASVVSADADCQDSGEALAGEPATDCDDGDAAINPDALEVCDGADNDCDGDTDPSDAWWDSAWSYRVPITLTGASVDTEDAPVLVDVDFAAHLASLGASGSFSEDSLRVVVQDCSLGQPELSSQFLDEVRGLLDASDHSDASGDGAGTVAFVLDGALAAGDDVELALYFDTSGTAPGYSTNLSASTTSLANAETSVVLDPGAGGLVDSLTWGGTQMTSQTDSCCGNGSFIGSWANTPMYVTGTTTVIEQGPVLALVKSEASMTAYDTTWWYWLWEGRPELWVKTHHVATDSASVYHANGFWNAVRPWESRQDAISSGATFTWDSTSYVWADVNDGSQGLAFTWVNQPLYRASMADYDPYLIVIGNDLSSASDDTVSFVAGDVFVDHRSYLLLPYAGAANAGADTLTGLSEGLAVTEGSAQGQ